MNILFDAPIAVLTAQAQQNESGAPYLRYAGNKALLSGNLSATSALMSGEITAGSDLLGGVSGFVKAMSGKSGSGGMSLPAGSATSRLY
jgi:hypothetical protein